jgi:hypothetical protein
MGLMLTYTGLLVLGMILYVVVVVMAVGAAEAGGQLTPPSQY